MEDVLESYAEPYDADRPVVCFDECGKELHGQVAEPISVAPGQPAKEDHEYVRNGTANLFPIVEPLAGTRQVTVTERRTIPDFAAQMKNPCDEVYPDAAVIRVVPDDLNTQTLGSLFASFPPDEAWRLEFHDTPKHASWLNVAECESSVFAGQCLGRRIPTRERLAAEVAAWVFRRNAEKASSNPRPGPSGAPAGGRATGAGPEERPVLRPASAGTHGRDSHLGSARRESVPPAEWARAAEAAHQVEECWRRGKHADAGVDGATGSGVDGRPVGGGAGVSPGRDDLSPRDAVVRAKRAGPLRPLPAAQPAATAEEPTTMLRTQSN